MTIAPSPAAGPWLLVPEVAERARCGKSEVFAALTDGRLRGYQRSKGGRWRVHVEDVDAWLRGEAPATDGPKLGRRAS